MWTKRSGNISFGDMWQFSHDEMVCLLLDAVKEREQTKISVDKAVKIDILHILSWALKEETTEASIEMVTDS